jgi:PAS domain S-box-containing protein
MPLPYRLGLQARTNLVVAATLLGFFLVTVWLDYRQQEEFVLLESVERARLIAFEAIRTRDYLSEQLQKGQVELTPERAGLIPVLASGRIAAQVAGDLEYRIRQISDRFRNPANAPDPYEQQVLQSFREGKRSELYQITGDGTSQVFRYLQAFRAEASCLECHGDPAAAPEVIRQLYPPETDRAYYYPLGEVIGAISIQIPVDRLRRQVLARLQNDLLASGGIFLALAICLGLLSRATVLQPLKRLEAAISRINNSGSFEEQLPIEREDEVGELLKGFNQMVASLGEKNRELSASETRYRMLTDTARDGIVSFLPDGKIILFNQQATRMFGFSKPETLGMSIETLVHPEQKGFHSLGIEAYLRQHADQLLRELQLVAGRKRDGSRIDLEVSLSRVETADHYFYTAILRERQELS